MTYDPVGAICRALFGEPKTIRQTTADVTPSVPKTERRGWRQRWRVARRAALSRKAASDVTHLVANEGIDVHARLMVWRGEHPDEASAHRATCDIKGCTACKPEVKRG